MDGLFDLVQDAIDRRAASVEVTYDPALGFPATIAIDYRKNALDEEQAYHASDLAAVR